ncbi:MAG TPA: tautomerase family protein [Solirubrobacteraceae bacterium]|jgi:phenylpyruvate tautomerase PptA (4-oxalocrotonate tautomerase family)
MPLVEIDLLEGRSEAELDAISDAVHEAMVAVLDVPDRDRFQIITERPPGRLRFDPNYLDIDRDERFLMIRITLSAGRSTDAKQAFYGLLAELLAERIAIRTENLAVVMIENEREDWSFGLGQASYLELPRDAWR